MVHLADAARIVAGFASIRWFVPVAAVSAAQLWFLYRHLGANSPAEGGGQVSVYRSLSAARYLFKLGRGLRRRRGKPVYDLPPSRVRRPLAGIQMGFITLALLPFTSLSTVRPLAVVVLVASLAVFARDYLVVAGVSGRSAR